MRQLHTVLVDAFPDVVSDSTVKRARRELARMDGEKKRYCTLISEANQEKRTLWCQKQLDDEKGLESIMYSLDR